MFCFLTHTHILKTFHCNGNFKNSGKSYICDFQNFGHFRNLWIQDFRNFENFENFWISDFGDFGKFRKNPPKKSSDTFDTHKSLGKSFGKSLETFETQKVLGRVWGKVWNLLDSEKKRNSENFEEKGKLEG